jgi:hypothetical protein
VSRPIDCIFFRMVNESNRKNRFKVQCSRFKVKPMETILKLNVELTRSSRG